MYSIAVAILFFEKCEQTIECVQSVLSPFVKVYILDNGSSEKSHNTLVSKYKDIANVIFFQSPKNLGPGSGRNYLIENISEDWIFFLDNDIRVATSNWYQILLNSISTNSDVDVFIPKLFNIHENNYVRFHSYRLIGNNISGEYPAEGILNCFPGGASCINKKLFKRIGLYSEKIKVLEDFEISIRALVNKQTIRCKLIDEINLIHDHRYSNSKADKLAIAERYNITHYSIAEDFIKNRHNVIFYSGWQSWVSAQLELFKNESVLTFLKQKTKTVMKIIFKYIS
jgi:GT2 family glycosyltransferase